jgi:uncharacterized protein (DUF433 family)
MPVPISSDGRIDGTRISVHDVYYYLKRGRPHTEIALILGLYPDDILEAIGYIVSHRPEMEAVYQQVEELNAKGNPPEIEEKRQQSRAKLNRWLEERRRQLSAESNGEGNPARSEH